MSDLDVGNLDPQGGGTTVDTAPPAGDDQGAVADGTQGLGSDDFWGRAASAKPEDAPQTFKDHWVHKSDFTRKSQESAERIKKLEAQVELLAELGRRAANEKVTPTGPTPRELKMKELQDLADAGDEQARQQLVDLKVEAKLEPIQREMTLKNAAEAARTNPMVGEAVTKHWPDIVREIQGNPHLARLASVENHAFAETVMVGLGLEHQNRDLAQNLKAKEEEIGALKAKVASLEKERNLGLPPSTSKAGPSAARPASAFKTDRDYALDAWVASGHRAEDFA